jgi:ribosome-interacting GTPase 1
MMPFENIQVQLVDTPALSRDYMESWLPGAVRNADLALILCSLASDDILEEVEAVIERLKERKVELVREGARRYSPDGFVRVRAVILATHRDKDNALENLEVLKDLYGERFSVYALSPQSGEGVEEFRQGLFEELRIIRVYTKSRGKPADRDDPVILPYGSTVQDFAFAIHKDIARNLKFARIWGKDKYDGQKVNRDYQLKDQDVVELHS